MQTANIGSLVIKKKPGIDTLDYSATIEYTGNVPFNLWVSIYLTDSSGNQIVGGSILSDKREWQPGEINTFSSSVTMPSVGHGVYGAACNVSREDTSQTLDEVWLQDHIEVPERKIYGYVMDEGGYPILGAEVIIEEYPQIPAYTDNLGYYELKIFPEVSEVVHLTASRLNYASNTVTVSLPGLYEDLKQDFFLSVEEVSANIVSFNVT